MNRTVCCKSGRVTSFCRRDQFVSRRDQCVTLLPTICVRAHDGLHVTLLVHCIVTYCRYTPPYGGIPPHGGYTSHKRVYPHMWVHTPYMGLYTPYGGIHPQMGVYPLPIWSA